MLRHIAWFNEAPIEPDPKGGLRSTDQRVRRRCLSPARELEKMGVECSVFGNMHDADPAHVSTHLQKLETDIVVIGRISGPSLLRLARAAKHLGCYVIADFGDDEAPPPEFDQLKAIVDQIVTASPAFAAAVECDDTSPLVIPDCDDRSKNERSPAAIARLWLDGFQKLKMKPPACANTNVPAEG